MVKAIKKIVLVFLLLPALLYAIAPPRNSAVQIPADMLEQIAGDATFYRARRSLQYTMRNFRANNLKNDRQSEHKRKPVRASVPVLCVQYADVLQDEWPVNQLQNMLFGVWPTGTMQQYFQEVSYNQFLLDGDVYGWYRLSGNSSYYERANINTDELLKEALMFFDADVDFSQYDNDGPDGISNSGDDDGFVDAVVFVHSGTGAEENGGPEIWSHFSQYSRQNGSFFVTNDRRVNGDFILIDDYMIVPAIQYNNMVNIGVFCHEFGHALGLPDLYDRDYTSSGVGTWCVMGYGSWGGNGRTPQSPSHFNAWCKDALGWVTPIVLTQNLQDIAVPSCETEPVIYKLWKNGNIEPYKYHNHLGLDESLGREYFLLENRQQIGFDTTLPGAGFLLWHVNNTLTDIQGNDDEFFKLVDLEEADGRDDLDYARNRGDSGDPFPGSGNNNFFSRTSAPNSLGYDGITSKIAVKNIHREGLEMRADIQALAEDIELIGYYINGDTLDKYLNPGETINLFLRLRNNGGYIGNVEARLSSQDPAIQITNAMAVYSDLNEDEIKVNINAPFVITAAALPNRRPALCKLHLAADTGYSETLDVVLCMENNRILLVDDSFGETDANGKSILAYYQNALDGIEYVDYDVWIVKDKMNPTRYDMIPYGVILWFTGSLGATFTHNEMANFRYLMSSGWKLVFSGQNIGKHLAHGSEEEKSFLRDWMHVRLLTENVGINDGLKISGLTGDPLSDEFRPYFYAAGGDGAGNQKTPEAIAPDSLTRPLFIYTDLDSPGHCAATLLDSKYKLVYFAFSLEAVNNKHSGYDVRRKLLEKTLDWLQGSVVTEAATDNNRAADRPQIFELIENYPNPFNQATTISFTLNKPAHTSLTVYNVHGQKVATLFEGERQTGTHHVTWNGLVEQNVPAASGVYFYSIKVQNYYQTKKMILLR